MFGYYLGEVQTVSIGGRRYAYSSSPVSTCHLSDIDWISPPVICMHFSMDTLILKPTVMICYYSSLSAYLLDSSSRTPPAEHIPFLLSALGGCDLVLLTRHQSANTYELVREALFAVERARELERQYKHLQHHRQFVLQTAVDESCDQVLHRLRAVVVEAQNDCRKLRVNE